jgi:hypothetical protein
VRTQIRGHYKAAVNSEIRAAGCQCKVDILLKNVGTEVSVHQTFDLRPRFIPEKSGVNKKGVNQKCYSHKKKELA